MSKQSVFCITTSREQTKRIVGQDICTTSEVFIAKACQSEPRAAHLGEAIGCAAQSA